VSHKSPRPQKTGSNDPSYRYTLADISVLLTTIDSLKQTIADQQQTITTLQTENAQLKARLAEPGARLNQNSTNSNRPPSSDGFRRPQTSRKKGGNPPGGQPGHPGRTLEQVADPDEITVHRVTTCSGCGTSLASEEATSVERRQVHDLPPSKDYCDRAPCRKQTMSTLRHGHACNISGGCQGPGAVWPEPESTHGLSLHLSDSPL